MAGPRKYTERDEERVFDYIAAMQAEGRAPTYREISKALVYPHAAVQRMIDRLAGSERVRRRPGSRGALVVETTGSPPSLPGEGAALESLPDDPEAVARECAAIALHYRATRVAAAILARWGLD